MLLRTMQAPPQPGSLREWVIILLLDRLEDIDHAKFRALAQLIVDKESGIKAFEQYIAIAFPSYSARKRGQEDDSKTALKNWVKQGPLKVTPMMGPKPQRSRLTERKVAKMADRQTGAKYEKVTEVWNKKTQQ